MVKALALLRKLLVTGENDYPKIKELKNGVYLVAISRNKIVLMSEDQMRVYERSFRPLPAIRK